MHRAVVFAMLEAIHQVTIAGTNGAERSQAVTRAHAFLVESLAKSELRAAFLEELAAAHARGDISRDNYRRIIATTGQVLKNAAELAEEIDRLLQPGTSR